MPLKGGSSRAAFSQNVKTEMAAGKPQRQAVAIAYSEARRTGKGREPTVDQLASRKDGARLPTINQHMRRGRT